MPRTEARHQPVNASGREIGPCNICQASLEQSRDFRWEKDCYSIFQCPSCGTLIRGDLPDSDALREIYGPAYFLDASGTTRGQGYSHYLGEEQNHRANAAVRVRLLERYESPGRLLDVGCAAGFFLDEARRRGWQVQGVELSGEMAAYARAQLKLDVWQGSFDDAALEPGTFDVITMWDYLEHSLALRSRRRSAAPDSRSSSRSTARVSIRCSTWCTSCEPSPTGPSCRALPV